MDKEQAEIIKKIYELGMEVGLKNHSEIGWVLREYNSLIEKANRLGVKSPEAYYNDGKIKGKENRDKGIDAGKGPERSPDAVKVVFSKEIETGKEDAINDIKTSHPNRMPTFNELPKLVRKTRATDMPELLSGFRPLKRR